MSHEDSLADCHDAVGRHNGSHGNSRKKDEADMKSNSLKRAGSSSPPSGYKVSPTPEVSRKVLEASDDMLNFETIEVLSSDQYRTQGCECPSIHDDSAYAKANKSMLSRLPQKLKFKESVHKKKAKKSLFS